MSNSTFPAISIREYPRLTADESHAYRILIHCYIRAYQIAVQIRAIEPVAERTAPIRTRAQKDFHDDPESIGHPPSRTDTVQRAKYLKRCFEVFDGPAQNVYELHRSMWAVEYAIHVIIDIELANCSDRNFWVNEAKRICRGLLGDPEETARLAAEAQSRQQRILSYPRALKLKIGNVLSYKLNGNSRKCRLRGYGVSTVKGEFFSVQDGPVGGPFEEREVSLSEMEELATLAESESRA